MSSKEAGRDAARARGAAADGAGGSTADAVVLLTVAGAVPSSRANARRCSSTASVCLQNSVRCRASAQGHSGARV